MLKCFDIIVSRDRMSAELVLKEEQEIDFTSLEEEIRKSMMDRKIVFGINDGQIKQVCSGSRTAASRTVIAQGIPPQIGRDAFLVHEKIQEEKSTEFNYRNILRIPSAKSGQILAKITQPTNGIPGKDIYGRIIGARNGKPLPLKPGKNTLLNGDTFYATADGQVSITPNSVNVFPVYTVKGDLDMKIGNINFVGNIFIDGSVPPGYKVYAGGDIRITGLVEGSDIEADGSIHISGGMAGQMVGSIKAGGDVHIMYLNQANVHAGNDVLVESSIMNSEVTAGSKAICKGHIIGGKVSAGKAIESKDIGNQHFIPTNLYIGNSAEIVEREKELTLKIKEIEASLAKLETFKVKLAEKYRITGVLSEKEKELFQKQHSTVLNLTQQLYDANANLEELLAEFNESSKAYLKIYGDIFPNVNIHFSKYSKMINHNHSGIKFFIENGEISSLPL